MTISLQSAQVINEYLRWLRAKKSAQTTVSTASHVLHGLARRAAMPILDIGPDDIRSWQSTRAEECAPATLRNHIAYVRGFYRWAIKNGRITADPSDALELPRAPRRLPHPMAEDDVARALAAADGDLAAILALGAFAGARACEIAGLDWTEVSLTGRTPFVRLVGKGRHERVVDVSPILADALAALPHRKGPVIRRRDGRPGHVTPTRVSQLANDHLQTLGIDLRLHSLRHRFGTRVQEEGHDLRVTQEAMGHASPTTTAGYAAVTRGSIRGAVLAAGELQGEASSPRLSAVPGCA